MDVGMYASVWCRRHEAEARGYLDMRLSRMLTGLVVAWVLVANPVEGLPSEGFGVLNKDFAVVNRVHPPRVFLTGTKIAVKVEGQTTVQKAAAERLRSLLESELLGADPRLSLDPSRPETLVEVTVVEDAADRKSETRRMTRLIDTGQKDAKGKPIFRSQEENVRYEIVAHSFSAAYRVQDVRSKANLDADTLNYKYSEEFMGGNGAPNDQALEASAISRTVEAVRARLTPTQEQVGVLLPRGSLKDLNNLATAGLWNQYLEALQVLPQRPKPEDEAYRQYATGLAYEALGYAAETADDTLRYLQQASAFYNQALQANPGEKYFSQPYARSAFNLASFLKPGTGSGSSPASTLPAPLTRVRAALVDYQRIKEFHPPAELESKALSATGEGVATAETEDLLDNGDVIDMVKAGLAEDIILSAIDAADQNSFDVSAKGLIQLGKAKVSKAVILRIQAKAAKS